MNLSLFVRSALLISTTALSFSTASAATGLQVSRASAPANDSVTVAPGWTPFLELGLGMTDQDDRLPVGGTPSSVKVLGSYLFTDQPIVVDAGGGLFNQQFTQSQAPRRAITGAVLEAAARYRWQSRWQAGVVVNDLLNQGSSFGARQGDAQFAGLQALKEFRLSADWVARMGGRFMTTVNPDERAAYVAMFDLHLGPAADRASLTQSRPATTPNVQANAMPKPASALQKVVLAERAGRAQLVQFPVNSSQLSLADQAYLKRLASALNENGSVFERIEIRGWADISGSTEQNHRLSVARAQAVRNALIEGGLAPARIHALGAGTKSSATVEPSDRRAELSINGVQDESVVREVFSRVR